MHTQMSQLTFSLSAFISRQEQTLKALLPNVDNQEEYQNLLSLVYKQGNYWMYHSKSLQDDSFKNHVDRVWRIVKYETFTTGKQNTFKVMQGDTIKFGRVRFQIKKLHVDKDDILKIQQDDQQSNTNEVENITNRVAPNSSNLIDQSQTQNQVRLMTTEQDNHSLNLGTDADTRMTQNFNVREAVGFDNKPLHFQDELIKKQEQELKMRSAILNRQNSTTKSDQAITCKICLSEEDSQNPMITPCNCTGSMQHIHFECLREWLEGKKHMKETPYVNSYIWKNLECEICKHSYSDLVTLKDGRVLSLLKYNVHQDANSYMIIESVTNTTSRTIHVINFSQKRKVRVGRGQNAEVRITDISVSRFHTLIKLNKKGEVIIQDNQSKFGTLVQLVEPLPVKLNMPLYLQIGRVVAVIFAIQRFSCIQRCFCALQKSKSREQCLHYDEVQRYFPIEFQYLFNNEFKKLKRALTSLDYKHGVLGPYRNYANHDENGISLDVSHITNNDNRQFDYQQQEINDQDIVVDQQQRSSHSNSRYNLPQTNPLPLREEDRQISVAIEFVTQIDRVDSENRQQIVNNLVQQMNNQSRARHAVSRIDSNNLTQGIEVTPQYSNQPTFTNVPAFPNLTILREEEEEEKDGHSGRGLEFEEQRNPLSYLNSQRNRLDDNFVNSNRDQLQDQDYEQEIVIQRSRLPNVKSHGGLPKIHLMSPTHTNRDASIFSVSRFNDPEEEEQRRLDLGQESQYEEVKVSQVDRMDLSDLPVNYNNYTTHTNSNTNNQNRAHSLYNQFDKNLKISSDKQNMAEVKNGNNNLRYAQQMGNQSVLTTLQATDSHQAQPTALNFSSVHIDTLNDTNINLSGKKREKRGSNFNSKDSKMDQ
eukprot:403360777